MHLPLIPLLLHNLLNPRQTQSGGTQHIGATQQAQRAPPLQSQRHNQPAQSNQSTQSTQSVPFNPYVLSVQVAQSNQSNNPQGFATTSIQSHVVAGSQVQGRVSTSPVRGIGFLTTQQAMSQI